MSQRDKRPKDCSKQSDGWNRDPCDPHMRGRDETAGRLLLDGRRSDPVQEPEEDGQATEDRTEILRSLYQCTTPTTGRVTACVRKGK